MADRNEIFRIILEGRDKLSKELDTVRRASDSLDKSLQKLKRNKPDEFPLFGGGKASRGPGGQFIKKEEIAALDKVRQKIDDINKSINILKRNKLKEGEFALFGGGRAIKGDDGRFIRVQDVTLLEKAKNRLDAIDKALVRIRTRVRRGPLTEDEAPGAGATRLTRNQLGQFVRAQDLSLIRRIGRELAIVYRGIKDIQRDTRQGLFLGTQATINNLRKVAVFADEVKRKIADALTGGPRKTRTGVDPDTGRFISVSNINTFQRFVNAVVAGGKKINAVNAQVARGQREIGQTLKEGLVLGFQTSRDTKRFLDEKVANTREELRAAKDALAERQELERLALTAEEDAMRRRVKQALENQREEGELKIEQLRIDAREAEDEADKLAIKAEIRRIRRERRLRESRVSADLSARFQARRANQRIEFVGQRREIDTPDVAKIEEQALRDRAAAINGIENSLKRMGARAGLAFGDIVRGAQSARKGIKDTDRDIRLLNNAFTRFGFAIGSIFKNFGQLVNLRWLFLTGILSTFLTLLVQIGTALVAVGASAIQAGAALGGAFLSGLSQALPVVGLLAAALGRFNTVLDQVKLNEKLDNKVKDNVDQIAQASQRLADAQYTLKRAIEAVADAQYDAIQANKDLKDSHKEVRDATQALRDAKVQAARDIVDANFEERDAALALREAELGVIDAKKKLREEEKKARGADSDIEGARAALREAQDRLRIATQQGDQSEISGAQQQLTLAEQNLSAVQDATEDAKSELKDAQLGVERAVLTVEQARVRNKRAAADAKTARQEGIAGSDVVKAAQDQLKQALEGVESSQRSVVLANRNVRDSLHQVSVAQREVADARKEETDAKKGMSQADKDAAAAFADLAPAEKKLYNALRRLRKTFKDIFVGNSDRDGILGPITEAMAKFADTLTKLLLDPALQRAASNLAKAIADAFNRFGEFVASDEFKEALLFFTERATANLPTLVDGLLNLMQVFLDIAKAANPIFDNLLSKAVGLTDKLRGKTDQGGEVRRPEEGAAGRLGVVTTINESGLDKFLQSASRHLDAWLSLSGAIIGLIDAITGSAAANSGQTLIDRLTDKLNEFSTWIRENPEIVQKFFDDAVESITNMARILGRLTEVLVKAFSSDEMQAFAQVIADIVIPGLVGLIFFLGKVSQGLLFILELPIVGDIVKFALAFLVFEKGLNKLFPVTQKITTAVQKLGLQLFRMFRFRGLIGGLEHLRTRLIDLGKAIVNATVQIGRFIIAMGKALIGVITRAASAIGTLLVNAFKALKISIRGLLIGTGIGALILAGVLLIENWEKVKKYAIILKDKLIDTFRRIVDWFRNNWKKVVIGLLLAPFLIGGAVVIGLLKFKDRILGIFTTIKNGIIGAFRGAFRWVREQFQSVVEWMQKQYDRLPGPVKAIIKGAGAVAGGVGKAAEGAKRVIGGGLDRVGLATGGTVPGTGKGDTVPAMLTPGEWVVNAAQQKKLAKAMGMGIYQARAYLFGTNSANPPGRARNNGLGKKVQHYGSYNLVSQEDEDGVTVWFIEMADGTFGQVTARDAAKIEKSNGTWIPNYVKRNAHGFKQNIQRVVTGGISGYAMGGVVRSAGAQYMARGGVVQAPGAGGVSRGGNTINQNFDVKTQGETDWGYVMRLGAVHAQESF